MKYYSLFKSIDSTTMKISFFSSSVSMVLGVEEQSRELNTMSTKQEREREGGDDNNNNIWIGCGWGTSSAKTFKAGWGW